MKKMFRIPMVLASVFPAVVHAQTERANSVTQFSGLQGQGGWYYGYWDRTADGDGAYSRADVTLFAPSGWTGSEWAVSTSPPPWTDVQNNNVHPNGVNSGHEHWAVRRWVSDFEGVAKLTGTIRKMETGAGDGTSNYIIVDNAYILRQDLLANDTVGTAYSVNVRVHIGSALDFVTAPGLNDFADRTRFTAHVTPIAEPIMDSGLGFSGSQGYRGWWYGWYGVATDQSGSGYQSVDFLLLPPDSWAGFRWYRHDPPGPRTSISYSHATPNDNSAGSGGPYWAIRRWVSNFAGNATLSGTLQKVTVGCGDGTRGAILRNGQEIWGRDLGSGDAMGFTYSLNLAVQQGDIFDFAVQDRASDGCDFTRFTAALAHTSCPADWDHSGAVNSADFFAFVGSFFAGNADFNGDGATNSQDFFDFIQSFFAGCP